MRECRGVFSSTEPGRRTLRKHRWAYSATTMSVLNSFRDLGAHINVTLSPHSRTLNARIKEATALTRKIGRLPLPHHDKAKLIRSHVLPLAYYGRRPP